jgi:putative flavoprotein involved in K+ transport
MMPGIMPEATVIVVGGGAAGLSAAAALTRRRLDVVVLEQDDALGGTWARRYDRLRLHTVRRFSGLAHFPIPRRFPAYLSREDVIAYLDEYARHFALRIEKGIAVQRIGPRESGASGESAWRIETTGGDDWHARVVVIATGQYREPIVPAWPGRDEFGGRLIHSSAYANAAPFAGQRLLVVGAGNSGAEIATDLARGAPGTPSAASVDVSVRTPPPIVPRDPFGMPVQRTGLLLSLLPTAIANRCAQLTARLTLGDLTRYGMPAPPAFAPYTTRRVPLIDVGFVDALKQRRLAIKPAVERLTATGVVFADGTSADYDAIVAATGFGTGLASMLAAVPDVLDEEGEPRGRSGEPASRRGLYFIGYIHSLRGHLFEANLASRRLARHVADDLAR